MGAAPLSRQKLKTRGRGRSAPRFGARTSALEPPASAGSVLRAVPGDVPVVRAVRVRARLLPWGVEPVVPALLGVLRGAHVERRVHFGNVLFALCERAVLPHVQPDMAAHEGDEPVVDHDHVVLVDGIDLLFPQGQDDRARLVPNSGLNELPWAAVSRRDLSLLSKADDLREQVYLLRRRHQVLDFRHWLFFHVLTFFVLSHKGLESQGGRKNSYTRANSDELCNWIHGTVLYEHWGVSPHRESGPQSALTGRRLSER